MISIPGSAECHMVGVTTSHPVGRYVWHIPLVGYGLEKMATPIARKLLIGSGALLLSLTLLVRIWLPRRDVEGGEPAAVDTPL